MKKQGSIFSLLLSGLLAMPLAAQQMGPQTLAMLEESPAGSKVIKMIKLINESGEIPDAEIQNLFSDYLIDKYGVEGLRGFLLDSRQNDGRLALYEVNRIDMFEYRTKLMGLKNGGWLDGMVKLDETSPYKIRGFGLSSTLEAPETDEPIYSPEDGREKKKAGKPVSLQEVARQTDEIARAYTDMGWFSGVVLLAKDGKPVFQKAYGLADEAKKIPNTMDTKFRIGSINKDFTAVLVLQQVGKGKLSLDDKLGQFDLGFPPSTAEKVTIRQLLSHTAGFGDIFIPEYLDNIRSYKTIDDILPLLREEPLAYEPGTDNRYSNYGYIVLGAILEKTTGKSFNELLEAHIYAPAGLQNIHYNIAENIEGEAQSYRFSATGEKIDHTSQLEYPTPDGGMYATAEDLLRFFQALFYGDKLLSDASKTLMLTDYKPAKVTWERILENPNAVAGFAGGGPGVSAVSWVFFKDNFMGIILANTDGNVAEEIAQRMERVYSGEQYPEPSLPPRNYTYSIIKEKGVDYLVDNYSKLMQEAGYSPGNPGILNSLGYSLMNEDKLEEAIQVFQANVRLFPKEANPYDSLAEAYLNNGQKDKALEYYKKALEIDPDFPSAKAALQKLGN